MQFTPTFKPDIYKSDFPGAGSRLVYGTSGLGGVWGEVDPEESIACLHYAFEKGITALDTAPSYSNSEKYVGKALKSWTGERPFISTKVGRLQAAGAYDFKLDYSPEGMRSSVKRSLDLLGVDQVDLLFLHEPQCVPLDKIEEIIATLKGIQADGLTKMIGVGGNPTAEFRPYITRENFQVVSGFCKLDACNLSAFESDIPYLKAHDISYYAASSLHFSLLGNRFEAYRENPPGSDLISNQDISHAVKVNEIAKMYNIPLATLAQRYLFSIREATRVVMGARNIVQIQRTIEDWTMGALPEDIFDQITTAITEHKINKV
ncbi:aldo/keto reductase [Pedobacter sp. PLR]|uniref:aldo/keto reductase n=1 Tax=Pedobacter sp. PLR TaxID=2994465 RepID=UPI002245250A|nr:aldo/keto reductase [Pedobacter sp. PLR]MCX2449759.1 aldo/keto reductase [Pedobacter sp. PLR]